MDKIITPEYISYRNPDKMKGGLRQCYKCKEYKSLDNFGISKVNGKPRYRAACRLCGSQQSKDYQARYPEKMKTLKRNNSLKSKYGITLDEYNLMLEAQNGNCAICTKKPSLNTNDHRSFAMAVDHDRRCCGPDKACSKCIRGLLCMKCNRALGMFEDDILILLAAVKYLEHYSNRR